MCTLTPSIPYPTRRRTTGTTKRIRLTKAEFDALFDAVTAAATPLISASVELDRCAQRSGSPLVSLSATALRQALGVIDISLKPLWLGGRPGEVG